MRKCLAAPRPARVQAPFFFSPDCGAAWHAPARVKEELSTGQAALRQAARLLEPLGEPGRDYSERLASALLDAEALDKRSALLANLRGAAFIAAASLAVLTVYGKLPGAAWYAAVFFAAAYVGLAAAHHPVIRRQHRPPTKAHLNDPAI